jgi:hypothetical protein
VLARLAVSPDYLVGSVHARAEYLARGQAAVDVASDAFQH